MEEDLRVAVALLALALASLPALAGEPYKPVALRPAEVVTPPAELVTAATAFLAAVKQGDGDAINAGLADRLSVVYGSLELALPRRRETLGPFKTVEEKLRTLANYTGGDYEIAEDGSDTTPYAIKAEREFIVGALTDGQSWGTDPQMKGAICSYAYRSFDTKAVERLAGKLKTASSSFFYVDVATDLRATPSAKGEVVATLQPDLLYGLDYETEAPSYWIAVHLPQGGTGFISYEKIELAKPYASGVCFSQDRTGRWVMSGQASTGL